VRPKRAKNSALRTREYRTHPVKATYRIGC